MPPDHPLTLSFIETGGSYPPQVSVYVVSTADLDPVAADHLVRLVDASELLRMDAAGSDLASILGPVDRHLRHIVVSVDQGGRPQAVRLSSSALAFETPGMQALIDYLRKHANDLIE